MVVKVFAVDPPAAPNQDDLSVPLKTAMWLYTHVCTYSLCVHALHMCIVYAAYMHTCRQIFWCVNAGAGRRHRHQRLSAEVRLRFRRRQVAGVAPALGQFVCCARIRQVGSVTVLRGIPVGWPFWLVPGALGSRG